MTSRRTRSDMLLYAHYKQATIVVLALYVIHNDCNDVAAWRSAVLCAVLAALICFRSFAPVTGYAFSAHKLQVYL